MADPRCGVRGCGRPEEPWCPQHAAAIAAGDSAERLRQAVQWRGDKQCPALAQYDGANCCALMEGHDGVHQNAHGSSHGTWGTREEFLAIATWYKVPGPPVAVVAIPPAPTRLLPAGIRRKK